jgi:hypothetical protein
MSDNKANGWQKAQTIAQYVQVGIVAVSAFFVLSQLRQQKLLFDQQVKLSRAANTQALVNLITPLNLKLTDPQMAELWVKGLDGIEEEPDLTKREIQKAQYESLVASNMIFYENVFSQYRAGLLDEDIYNGWDKDLAAFIEEHKIAKVWGNDKDLYRKDFSDRVDQIIASQK